MASSGPRGSRKQLQVLDAIVADLRKHYDTDWDTTIPGEEFNAEIKRIVMRHLTPAAPETPPDSVESLREALRKYGKHLTGCACFDEFDEKACDCGFGKYEVSL